MTEADWKEVESQLALCVPTTYRMFFLAAASSAYDLSAHGIYGDTDAIVEGNLALRLRLAGSQPPWEPAFLSVGLGDGEAGYYFLTTESQAANRVCLWSPQAPDIQEMGSARAFFRLVLDELGREFAGAAQRRLAGLGPRPKP